MNYISSLNVNIGTFIIQAFYFREQTPVLKDPRYKAVKSLIESKALTSLKEVFTIIPLSVVKNGMKGNYNTLRSRVNKGDTLTVKDLVKMAALFEVDPTELFKLVLNDFTSKNRQKK
jgi:hypothetical protein